MKRTKQLMSLLLCLVLVGWISLSAAASNVAGQTEEITDASAQEDATLAAENTVLAWDFSSMGNDPNVLLSGGGFYSRNGLQITPEADSPKYVVHSNSGETWNTEKVMSYINVWNDLIIYRDDSTRKIRTFNINTRADSELLAVNAGEVFLYDGTLYYTDLSQNDALFRCALDGSDRTSLLNRPVRSFVVSRNQILFLGGDQALYSVSTVNQEEPPVTLVNNVERFFLLEEGILAESGNAVFQFLPGGTSASSVYRSEKDNMRLVGTFAGQVFYQENGYLYCVSEETSMIVSTPNLYYSSPIVKDDGEILLLAFSRTGKSQGGATRIAGKLLSLKKTAGFYDIKPDAYYVEPVKWAVDSGITSGTSATSFSPGNGCTTAHAITFLWRASGQPVPTIDNPFSDVNSEQYFYNAALWAYEHNLVNGPTFNGGAPCRRSQIVTYLWKLAGSPVAEQNAFTDVPMDASYGQAVSWAVARGVTSGTTATTFTPDATCTRGQIVTFLYRNAHT